MHTQQRDLVVRSLASSHKPDVFPIRRPQESERSLAEMVVQAHAGQPDDAVSLYVLAARTMVVSATPPSAA